MNVRMHGNYIGMAVNTPLRYKMTLFAQLKMLQDAFLANVFGGTVDLLVRISVSILQFARINLYR